MKIFFSIICGYVVAELILSNQILLGILLILIVSFMQGVSLEKKFIVFSLTVFLPITLPYFLIIPDVSITELFSPLFCSLIGFGLLRNREEIFLKKSWIFYGAILLLIVVALINFLRRPVSGRFLLGSTEGEGGLRSYYAIFVGVATFFASAWFFCYKRINARKYMVLLTTVSLVIGYSQLAAYLLSFQLPFLGGVFKFKLSTQESFFRIGGLTEMVILGIAATLSLYYRARPTLKLFILMLLFLCLLFFSGGRTGFLAILLNVAVYILMIDKKKIVPFILCCALVFGFIVYLQSNSLIKDQASRFLAFGGGLSQQDPFREEAFRYYVSTFLKNPVIGKGIGSLQAASISPLSKIGFVYQQLRSGGHGSYLSILAIFGIAGILFLVTMLLGGICYSYGALRRTHVWLIRLDTDKFLFLFAFQYLIMLALLFVTGGNGFNSMEMWFLCGMVAGLRSRYDLKEKKRK